MTCGRAHQASGEHTHNGAAASHSAELVRGKFIRQFPKAPSSALRAPRIKSGAGSSPQGEKERCGWRRRFASVLVVLMPAACSILYTQAAAACPSASEGYERLATPEAEIAYRWEPADVKVGRFFEAEVVACRMPGAGEVSRIVIDARMPAHGHGMNVEPALSIEDGVLVARGMLLHMIGHWELYVDLTRGPLTERAQFDFELR